MSPFQVTRAHQKLIGDLASRKLEILLEKLDPFGQLKFPVGIQPYFEGTEFFPSQNESVIITITHL